jgi:hypothetical protein
MPDLVEPTGQAVDVTQISGNTAAAAASSAASQGQSAASSLRDAMQQLSPAVEKPTAAQQASGQSEAAPAVEKKEFPPIGSDVAEQKKVEVQMDTPAEAGSALEGFRKDLSKARRQKEKDFVKARDGQAAEPAASTDAAAATTDATNTDSTATTAAADEAPVTDEEIEKTISDPAISKRHQKRMVHLANRAKELETKLKELEAKPQTDANDAKIKEISEREAAAQKELMQYRRRYSAESEPEIKKFDEVAQKADEAILTKLKEANLSEKTIDLIKGMGGFEGFSRSNQVFTINVKDAHGEVVEQQVTAAQLARKWLNDMNIADAEYIKSKLGERFSAVDGKKNKLNELAAEAETFFKSQQEQQKQAEEKQRAAMLETHNAYKKWADEWAGKQDWLKDKPVLPTATPEEKKEIESWNRMNAGIREVLTKAANLTSVADYTALVEGAASHQHYKRENARIAKENESLKEQLSKIQKGISTTGKPGGSSIQTATKKKDDSAAAQLATPATDSLREAMEKLRLGNDE